MCLHSDEWGKPCLPPHMGEDKWVTTWNTRPNYKIMPADWEGSVRSEEEAIEEASAKEEAMMLEEFIRRLEFNKLQVYISMFFNFGSCTCYQKVLF